MDSSEVTKQFIQYIKSRWNRPSTLFILLLVLGFLLLWLFSGINIREVETREYFLGGILLSIVILVWFYSNRIPKAPIGKIGFALGIVADNPEQQQKLKRDFSDTLRALLNRSKYRYSFVFIDVPNHFIEKISSPDDATKTLHNLRSSFLIYGKIRNTIISGQTQSILSLEGAVAHKPIATEISKSLSKEFAELFPRKMIISQEGDLFQFEITAQWIDIVSKYIIGIASLLSADIGYAEELFEGLQKDFSHKQSNLPALVKIKQRLPSRLHDIYIFNLKMLYEDWRRSKDNLFLSKMKLVVDKLNLLTPHSYDARFYKSILYFLDGRNINKAKQEAVKAQKENKKHTSWQYNYGFLLAYEGNMYDAIKQYKIAVNEYYEDPGLILEVVEFIMWVLDVEPDKTQLHFCLGYIYYFAIKDYALALQCFEKFLEVTPNNRFPIQRKEAEKLISQIQKDIKGGKIVFET